MVMTEFSAGEKLLIVMVAVVAAGGLSVAEVVDSVLEQLLGARKIDKNTRLQRTDFISRMGYPDINLPISQL